MRVAIVGAGAMGTLLGHGFCRGGHHVSMLDLPDRVCQLKSTGKLVVVAADGSESSAKPDLITSDYEQVLAPDVVILATKSQDLPAIAENVAELSRSGSAIVTIQNGIPWWYLQELSHDYGDVRIDCLDPNGLLEKHIRPDQLVGCVAYPAASLGEDGRAHHVEGAKFPVGELDGSVRERTTDIARLFESSGFRSRTIKDIRSEIWLKAWGALSINPISALTHATMEDICTWPETKALVARMMSEAQVVGEAYGATFRHTIEKRIEGARAVGAHKTSMLQDLENGRPLELDGLMLAIIQRADKARIEVPLIRNIYACAAPLNQRILSDCRQREARAN
jgi:2-dehydropantoate 2-reductase